jgi:hypothetical protein
LASPSPPREKKLSLTQFALAIDCGERFIVKLEAGKALAAAQAVGMHLSA